LREIFSPVIITQNGITKYHQKIQRIQEHDHIAMVHDLVQNSAQVPDQQQVQKNETLSFTRPCDQHFADRKRPTHAETRKHPDLKPTHSGETEIVDGEQLTVHCNKYRC
jgi:hypothetical protein